MSDSLRSKLQAEISKIIEEPGKSHEIGIIAGNHIVNLLHFRLTVLCVCECVSVCVSVCVCVVCVCVLCLCVFGFVYLFKIQQFTNRLKDCPKLGYLGY